MIRTGPLLAWAGTRPRFLALAAFLFAGDLKADPRLAWFPVDLTLLAGTVLSGVIALCWLRGARLRSRAGAALAACWFLSFAPGLFQAAGTDYAFQKVATIFSFSLLSALAPMLLVESERDLPLLIHALAGFCLAITLGGLLGGGQPGAGGQAAQRLQAFGAGTISLGRATGLLFTCAALALAAGGPLPVLTSGVMALAGITALFSGSRGPILAALAVLALLLGTGRIGRARGRLLLAAALFLAVLGGSLSLAPPGSLNRVAAFFRGEYGESETYRVNALRECWRLVGDAPWGLGWGGFATFIDPERGVGRQYPHNLLAEVTLESGWVCGAVTLAVLGTAVAAGWSGAVRPGGRLVFAGLLFYLINSMVSGDLNDNRPLFMFAGTALTLRGLRP